MTETCIGVAREDDHKSHEQNIKEWAAHSASNRRALQRDLRSERGVPPGFDVAERVRQLDAIDLMVEILKKDKENSHE